ncbi:carbohydrate sulfotransferase 11-like isoform X1 [Dermacentor albipictus]|uniref:carbohydrate sulfotransferase 11-like isoform X1 n=1 Tax=Dermacentor albipictus TaxID=60249 RepID=UPI0038FCBBF3
MSGLSPSCERLTFTCLCICGCLFVFTTVFVQLPRFRTSIRWVYDSRSRGSQPLVSDNTLKEHRTVKATSTQGPSHEVQDLTERVRRFCQRYTELQNKRLEKMNETTAGALKVIYKTYKHLLYAVNPRNNRSVLYCSIPKVANTSLKTLLLSLNESHRGKYTDSTMHFYVYSAMGLPFMLYRNDVTVSDLANAFKVMFVRHPFERLVSFFEDKTRRTVPTGKYFYYKYWNDAMVRFRGVENVDTQKDLITFEEFVDLLLSIHPSKYDLHWQLYSDRCEPCLVPYDFVGTLEDVPVMYSALGVTNRSQLWVNKGPSDTRNVALSYFSRLPRSKVVALYGIYAVDFMMFGYSAEEYLNTVIGPTDAF